MKDPTRTIAEWLGSCQTRFENMYNANIDKDGWPNLQRALKDFDQKRKFTVGQIQYLFNRTHPKGIYADYNTHKNLHKKFGTMLPCPVKELVDANVIDWRSGQNGVMQPNFASAIKQETNWEWRNGNLRAQQHTTFDDLFN